MAVMNAGYPRANWTKLTGEIEMPKNRYQGGIIAKMCRLLVLCAVPLAPAFAQTLHHFDFSTITSPRQAYVPFRIILTAKSSTGATVRTFTGTVQLTASGAGGA